jgi:oligosaccharyl transferase (archaeosortase A-associated)
MMGRGPSTHVLAIASVVAVAFGLRLILTWNAVFGEDYVSFVENDAWYHMRLVDAVVRNFPWRIWHDPYLLHPAGEAVNAGPMLDWIVAGVALLIGGGAPSPRLVDLVGAFVPPVIGALTVVPVYVIGRELFGRVAGLWAGVLVAVMPGQLVLRSVLGFTDHHCLEILLSTTAMMFVILAIGAEDRSGRRRATLLAGFSLGCYCLTWGGAVLFVAVLSAFAGAHLLVDSLKGRDAPGTVRVVVPTLLLAAGMVAPWINVRPQFRYQCVGAVAAALMLWGSDVVRRVAQRRGWYPVLWVSCVALAAIAAVWLLLQQGETAATLLSDAFRTSPFRQRGVVREAQPLMLSEHWKPVPLWREYTVGLPLSVAGFFFVLLTRVLPAAPRILLVVWTAIVLAATFGQIRFAHYLGVNVALLAGLMCARALGAAASRPPLMMLLSVVLALVLAIPGWTYLAPLVRQQSPLAGGWHDALKWMEVNTPEPFGDPSTYFHPDAVRSPQSEYGVLSWWSSGYWISRMARRVPISNPRQSGAVEAAAFFLSTSEAEARSISRKLGARYTIVDARLQAAPLGSPRDGIFASIATTGGADPGDYCGVFSKQEGNAGNTETSVYCYPRYFQTTAIRLLLYGGRAAQPVGPITVVRTRSVNRAGRVVQQITGEWAFPDYLTATRFVGKDTTLKVVSKDPHRTCVPLESYAGYVSVYRSIDRDGATDGPHLVQIFEDRGR